MSKDEAKFLHVTDMSCNEVAPVRTHTIIVRGEHLNITFKHGEKTILPFEQGLKFHKDGFKVEEMDGASLSLPAVAAEGVAAQLAKDECVAKFTELTFASLKVRAAAKTGGEIYADADESDKADVIAFLIGEPPVSEAEPEAEEVETDDDDNLIDDGETEEAAAVDIVLPAPFITVEAFQAKYGDITYDGLMTALVEAYGATTYAADNEKQTFSIIRDGVEIASGPLDDLIASAPNPNAKASGEISKVESDLMAQDPAPAAAPNGQAAGTGGNDERKFTVAEVKQASDEAMALAAEYGVDLADVKGTGADGNIKKGDVKAYITEKELKALQPVEAAK